jgi:hypothetical protein
MDNDITKFEKHTTHLPYEYSIKIKAKFGSNVQKDLFQKYLMLAYNMAVIHSNMLHKKNSIGIDIKLSKNGSIPINMEDFETNNN